MAKIFNFIKHGLRDRLPIVSKDPRLRILNYRVNLKRQNGRALLAYLPELVERQLNGMALNMFSNEGLAVSIPQALNELGYDVDIVSWQDDQFVPEGKYDLFVAHGGKSFDHFAPLMPKSCSNIYFSSGSYWEFNNQQEANRLKDLEERRGIKLPPDRTIDAPERAAHYQSNGIISLGNKTVLETYPKDLTVFPVNSAVYPDQRDLTRSRDYAKASKNWLFYAGGGNVHKGLDLVLDAFPTDCELYICTHLQPEFADAYKDKLAQPNIHMLGFIENRSRQFYDLLEKCGFIISASCSEGQPGSVLEAMQQGLVPVISKFNNLNIKGFGSLLEPCDVPTIAKQIGALSRLAPAELRSRSLAARQQVITHHQPEQFITAFKQVADSIINL